MNPRLKFACLCLTILLVFCWGCVPVAEQFNGNRVTKAPIIALQADGSQAGSWQTFDIRIDYQYRRNSDILEISGRALLSEYYQALYTRLKNLKVYLFFLDDHQRVLETSLIATSLSIDINQLLTFKRSFQLPQGTKHVAFGYDGVAAAERGLHSFYLLPLGR